MNTVPLQKITAQTRGMVVFQSGIGCAGMRDGVAFAMMAENEKGLRKLWKALMPGYKLRKIGFLQVAITAFKNLK